MTDSSPAQTARDLRNASLIVEHAGHATGEFVDSIGRVCADGAIRLATGEFKLIRGLSRYDYADGSTYPSGAARTRYAERALVPLLPVDCRGACSERDWGGYPDRDTFHRSLEDTYPESKVIHFNDFICRGGDELAELLVAAAEKVEAEL